jgi:hypothetical protein
MYVLFPVMEAAVTLVNLNQTRSHLQWQFESQLQQNGVL